MHRAKEEPCQPHALFFGNSMRNSTPPPPLTCAQRAGRIRARPLQACKNVFPSNRVGLGQFSAPPTALSAGLGASWRLSEEASSLETQVLLPSCHSSTRRCSFENCPIRSAAWAGRWGDAPLRLRFHSLRIG